jgi:hypothetical protein
MNVQQRFPSQQSLSAEQEHEIEVWALLGSLEELEAEVETLRSELASVQKKRGRPLGGPPPEWDEWAMRLRDDVFMGCLGPKNLPPLPERELSESNRPSRAVGELIRHSFAGERETVHGHAQRKGLPWR